MSDRERHLDSKEYLKHRKNRREGDAYFPAGTVHDDEYFQVGSKRFVWDKAKNESNKLVHGIDFYTAAYVFNDEDRLEDDNFIVDGEEREQTIGEPMAPTDPLHPIDTRHAKPKAVLGAVEGIIFVVFVEDKTDEDLADAGTDETGRQENIREIISARPAFPHEAKAYMDSVYLI